MDSLLVLVLGFGLGLVCNQDYNEFMAVCPRVHEESSVSSSHWDWLAKPHPAVWRTCTKVLPENCCTKYFALF